MSCWACQCGIVYAEKFTARLPIVCSCGTRLEERGADATCKERKPRVSSGPGTELKSLFSIVSWWTGGCRACDDHAAEMDRAGCDWCRENIDTILGWISESSAKLGVPFNIWVARMAVLRAIQIAEGKEANALVPPSPAAR